VEATSVSTSSGSLFYVAKSFFPPFDVFASNMIHSLTGLSGIISHNFIIFAELNLKSFQ
jgi:hypothetical protein